MSETYWVPVHRQVMMEDHSDAHAIFDNYDRFLAILDNARAMR
jgi:hypothetical protein